MKYYFLFFVLANHIYMLQAPILCTFLNLFNLNTDHVMNIFYDL